MIKKILIVGTILILCMVDLSASIATDIRISENDHFDSSGCASLVATGTCVKNNRSIFWKNRHATAVNQVPIFFQGTQYKFIGIGNPGDPDQGECRQGMNEKGLAIGNLLVESDTLTQWKYLSDEIAQTSDDNILIPLGNCSTVAEAALWIAQHGYHGSTWGFQFGIVSAERGVGAVVSIDKLGHTNITWVNNSYVVLANVFFCNGDHDPDGTDIRAKIIVDDIVNNESSSEGDSLINWQDVCQRLAKDTHDKEDGQGNYSYSNEISGPLSYSAMVAVSGNSSYNASLNTVWVNIGKTTQISIFLPISAAYLQSNADIPSVFIDGNGIQPYVNVKYQYAFAGPSQFNCNRVREIQEYAFYNENITFHRFDVLMKTIMTSANETEAKARMRSYIEDAVDTALFGYVTNLSLVIQITKPEQGLYINNKKILPFTSLPPVIVKSIDIETLARTSCDIDHVEFLVDGVVQTSDTSAPYMWTWDQKIPFKFRHILQVTVYDTEGFQTSDDMMVWKFL